MNHWLMFNWAKILSWLTVGMHRVMSTTLLAIVFQAAVGRPQPSVSPLLRGCGELPCSRAGRQR